MIVAKVLFGSHLYGTQVLGSDTDYRAIYLPPLREVVLGTAKHAWKDEAEEDTSYFSLQHFMRLAVEGQSVAIELLAAPTPAVVATSDLWQYLRDNRKRFYTKRMQSLCGFAKTIAAKYASRAGRLNETEAVLAVLKQSSPVVRLSSIWDTLPESPHARKEVNAQNKGADQRVYRICGRELQATVTVAHAFTVIQAIGDAFGERVRQARVGELDYKAIMHAFRAALQCKEIVETGDLIFPLRDAAWLRELRLGHIDFTTNALDTRLDDLINEVQTKMDASDLPDRVDQAWVDQLILRAYDLS